MSKEEYTWEPGEDTYYRVRKPDGNIALPHNLCRTLNSSKLNKFRKFMAIKGNIVVVQHPEGMGDPAFEDVLQQFADELLHRTGVNVFVIAVNKLSEIVVLDEDRMETYGWVKKNRVLMMKEDDWDTVKEDEEE